MLNNFIVVGKCLRPRYRPGDDVVRVKSGGSFALPNPMKRIFNDGSTFLHMMLLFQSLSSWCARHVGCCAYALTHILQIHSFRNNPLMSKTYLRFIIQ